MFKKSVIVFTLAAILATPVFAGGNSNNNGPIFGGDTTNNYNTTNKGGNGYGVGVGKAQATAGASAGAYVGVNNKTNVGVGVKNTNANFGVNTLSNKNDLSNRNSNYMEGSSQNQSINIVTPEKTYHKEDLGFKGEYRYEYEAKLYTVPDAIAPSVQPTVPCAIPVNAAGSLVGGALSFGTAYIDTDCNLREDIRLGLSGDSVSRNLANQVIQVRLRGHLDDAADEVASNVKPSGKSNYWDVASN